MPHEWKEALDQIHADEALKQRTRQFVQQNMARQRRPPAMRVVRRTLYAACACLAVCLLAAGYYLYFTPTSIISVDINPSLELSVNRFDRVIDVTGYNEDGEQLAGTLDLLYQDYTQAVTQLLDSETVQTCLARDELLSIAVVEIDPQQGQTILQYVSSCTAQHRNAYCYSLAPEEVEQAHEAGLSYGKYKAYQEILAYTDAYTPEQIGAMTMRQIRELLYSLQTGQEPSAVTPSAGGGYGHGGEHGNGNGYGRHNAE